MTNGNWSVITMRISTESVLMLRAASIQLQLLIVKEAFKTYLKLLFKIHRYIYQGKTI